MNEEAFKQTNWKQWQRGLRFALWIAVAQVLINFRLVLVADWKDGLTFVLSTIGGAAFGYMQKHPAEAISETEFVRKTDNEKL